MLTHCRRRRCGACGECPGFCIVYRWPTYLPPTGGSKSAKLWSQSQDATLPPHRSCDASVPDVMFFCSRCGCRAEAHAVDPAWQAAEALRLRQEAAAAAQRAQQQQHQHQAAPGQAAREREAYAELGLSPGADPRSVARAFKRLALTCHPDKQAGQGQQEGAAAERFLRITRAYKLLTQGA